MRTMFLRILPASIAILLAGMLSATGASAATGQLRIITDGTVRTINNPTGCFETPSSSEVTVINGTQETVYLWGTPHCTGFIVPIALPAGQQATGFYASVLA
jgi:hypothetical protein